MAHVVTLCILALSSPGEVRVAAVRGNELLDYAIWRPGAPDGVGDLLRGRVSARVPAMGGCFVTLPGSEGFLPDSEGGKGLGEGTVLPVRITRSAQGGKGPRLTAKLLDADRRLADSGPPALLRSGPSAVEIMACRYPEAAILVDDPGLAAQLRPQLGDRVGVSREPLDDALDAAMDALALSEVSLPSGGHLHIEPTSALVAIDVDTGGASSGRREKVVSQFGFNRQILPVLARQIRLRNLAGAILVDFAGLSPRRRQALGPEFAELLREDPLRPRFLGFTALGLAEIVRPRVHPPLHELLSGPHAAGLSALREAAREASFRPGDAPALRAAPAVIAALQADPVALPDLARRTGRSMILRSDPTLPACAWVLEGT
ncbi:MAG: ribonuclease E/G [Alphaproteobacteria bacterium]|nr:ribonuclease E/G [Alphaproteobacteria bacterium]